MLAIITLHDKNTLKDYFHLEFIQPLLDKENEIYATVYNFDTLDRDKLLHLVASITTESLSDYFKMEYVDFDVYSR